MALTVYPRLGELLRERDMSVAELTRRIEQRYGRSVDPKTLYRLTTREPIQRVDIALIGHHSQHAAAPGQGRRSGFGHPVGPAFPWQRLPHGPDRATFAQCGQEPLAATVFRPASRIRWRLDEKC